VSGWQVGDLALCVDNHPRLHPECNLRKGQIYRVLEIVWSGHAAQLEGVESYGGAGFWLDRFRKIKPDTEPCEKEFTVLIKRGRKVSV
jgi:hypothetical protein